MKASTVKLHVEIYGIGLPIWRKFTISNNILLRELNYYLVEIMGWNDSSMYDFFVDGLDLKTIDQDTRPGFRIINPDYSRIKLSRLELKKGIEFRFTQRTHKSLWIHKLIVEEYNSNSTMPRYPILLDGFGACPPNIYLELFDFMRFYNMLGEKDEEAVLQAKRWLEKEYVYEKKIEKDAVNKNLKEKWDYFRKVNQNENLE
jgi:hypothetical protein